MDEYIIPADPIPTLAVHDSEQRFPVRRIFCVARNYADHAREMGQNPERDEPFFFTKPADAVVDDGSYIPYPAATNNLHHEVELVIALKKGGQDIAEENALSHVWGYGVGNDLTRRDLQKLSKEKGRPWDLAKGFDNSAICGALHPVEDCGHITTGRIVLFVNDELRQEGNIGDMIWSAPEIIALLSKYVELRPGDLIYTGTPAGVGPLVKGDVCRAEIEGLGRATITLF